MPGMTLFPGYNQFPVLMPDFMPSVNHVIYGSKFSMPGLNLPVVFMNMHLTYEDGMVMSRTASKRFKYEAEVHRIVSAFSKHIPKRGSIIDQYSRSWW